MHSFVFSAKEIQFFILEYKSDYEKNGIWPNDAVTVSKDIMQKYSAMPPDGKILGADKKGMPTWVAIPPLTHEQQIAEGEAEKQRLIAEVHTETEMLRTKLAFKRIKPDEEVLLNAWLDYLDELEAVDTSTAPDIIWPVKPVA